MDTTISKIGIDMTDVWKIMRAKHEGSSPFSTITQLADMTANDMNQYEKNIKAKDDVLEINE